MSNQEVIRQGLVHVARACSGGPSDNLTVIIALAIVAVAFCFCAWLFHSRE